MSGGVDVQSPSSRRGAIRWLTWISIEHKIFLSVVFALGWYFYGAGAQGADFLSRKSALTFIVLLMAAPSIYVVITTLLHSIFRNIGFRILVVIEIPLYAALSAITYYLYLSLWINIILHNGARRAFGVFFRWMGDLVDQQIPNAVDTVSLILPNGRHLSFGIALEWVLAIYLVLTIIETIIDSLRPRRRFAA
jgi:hypothetical protein